MFHFQVNDMTCGHCASTITKAVKSVDAGAKVSIDLETHRVSIEAVAADAAELGEAITEAGYTPVATQASGAGAPQKAGGCCGCCH